MAKILYFPIFFLIFTFVFASNSTTLTLETENILKAILNLLQKNTVTSVITPQSLTSSEIFQGGSLLPVPPLPKNIKPAIPVSQSVTPEVIKTILPDENREDDAIVQINNLKITRIVTSTPDANAVIFAVRDIGWRCLLYESEESYASIPCSLNLRKPILQRELVIKLVDYTILLFRDRKRANIEKFQIGDKINVYGFMDKNNYGIEALIVRNLSKSSVLERQVPSLPIQPIKQPFQPQICIQVITPAQNPQTGECKEFSTPCDVPTGWIKVNSCKSYFEYLY